SVDNHRARLALADASTQRLRLFEGEPALRAPAMLDRRKPQQQNVHAGIGPPGGGILGKSEGRYAGGSPGLGPWKASSFELRNDAGGNCVVERLHGRVGGHDDLLESLFWREWRNAGGRSRRREDQ